MYGCLYGCIHSCLHVHLFFPFVNTLIYVDIEQGMHKGKIDTAVNAPIHTVVNAAIHVLLQLPIHTECLHQPTHARGYMAECKVVYIGESSKE